jgi:hypothetical protein
MKNQILVLKQPNKQKNKLTFREIQLKCVITTKVCKKRSINAIDAILILHFYKHSIENGKSWMKKKIYTRISCSDTDSLSWKF